MIELFAKAKNVLIIALALLFSLGVSAKDLGFRYNGTSCVNATGQVGLNPSFVGPCSDLRNVVLDRFDFGGVDLTGSQFQDADIQASSMQGAILTACSFINANLSGVDFQGATMLKTDFTKATLRNVQFVNVNLQDVIFEQADLTGINLSGSKIHGGRLAGTRLDQTILDDVDWSGSDLNHASLLDASLQRAHLEKVDATNTAFSNANLAMAHLDGLHGKGSNFQGANLRQTSMKSADLTGANLKRATIDSADLNQTFFDQAFLSGASLKSAQVSGSTFKQATYSKSTVLPFAADQAKSLGMVLKNDGVLVILENADDPAIDPDLRKYLVDRGLDVTVSPQFTTAFDGTIPLADYGSIILIDARGTAIPNGGQDALVNFVKNGGNFIAFGDLVFAAAKLSGLREIFLFDGSTFTRSMEAVTRVKDVNSPVLDGIADSISLQITLWENTLHTFTDSPGMNLAVTADGPVVAVRNFGKGHAISFAMTSFNADDNFKPLSQEPFEHMIFNAASW